MRTGISAGLRQRTRDTRQKDVCQMNSFAEAPRFPVSHIILRLARSKAFPEGSLRRGYDIRAVIDAAGHLSADAWHKHKTAYSVQRFWDDEPIKHGMLLHRAGGADGATWAIHYAGGRRRRRSWLSPGQACLSARCVCFHSR